MTDTEGEWTAQLDRVDDMKPFYTGTEEGAKQAAREHRDAFDAFVEDPEGNAFAWNPFTQNWDEL